MSIVRTKLAEDDIKDIYLYSYGKFGPEGELLIIRVLHQRMDEVQHLGS